MRSICGAAAASLVLAAPAAGAPERILYVGDSLGVGTTPGFARELGSSAQVEGDSRIGRPSPEGLRVLAQRVTPADDIAVFDLGTNDDPASPGVLARDLHAARQASGSACLIVATLNRPPLNGVTVDGLNHAVLAFASSARNVQLVDWNAIVSSEPSLLGPDHVHPTPQGYQVRAQLFAEAVAECSAPAASQDNLTPAPTPRPKKARPRKPRPQIKVPGIESSGISFTEPLRFHRIVATLLLPNTKPPYPAVVMVGGAQAAADFLSAHGIATLTFRDRGSASDVAAAVALLKRRKEIRSDGVGIWAGGNATSRAAAAAPSVAALVAVGPAVMSRAEQRDWQVRRRADAAPVSNWLRLRARSDPALRADPTAAWAHVRAPVLAIWGTRDDRVPIRASAEALRRALAQGGNKDRTFRWFDAGHAGAVVYRDHEPVYAPGFLEETARWLGLHLGARRANPVIQDRLPPANPGPAVADVARASAIYAPPIHAIWLIAPALMLIAAAIRSRRSVEVVDAANGAGAAAPRGSVALIAAAGVTALAALAAIAAGVAAALDSRALGSALGTPAPFALAWILAAIALVAVACLARRRAWLAATGAALWIGLALFWLL